jgi:hypothetical protein
MDPSDDRIYGYVEELDTKRAPLLDPGFDVDFG